MRASIIIASHQEGERLWKTVGSCVETATGLDHEIVVADDASTDGSVEELERRFPQVRVVRHDQRIGASPTKALGGRNARGNVLVFLDGHTKPEPGALRRLVDNAEAVDGQAVITPAIAPLNCGSWQSDATQAGHGYGLDLREFSWGWLGLHKLRAVQVAGRRFYESPALIGCALAVGRELYDRLWGFDAHMRIWGVEDVDFGLKCWLLGYRVLHDPEALVGHRFRSSFDNYDVPVERVVVNQLRMARKHFTPTVWAQWVDHCRERHQGPLPDVPEGLWVRAWQLFEADRDSVERERAYLLGHRARDEFWFAERFSLGWPRVGAVASAPAESSPAPLVQPFADPSPPPVCQGTLSITGPAFCCVGDKITLVATMSSGAFPAGKPVWTIVSKPDGSELAAPPAGEATVTVTPDVEGQYVIQAACDDITSTFTFTAVTITLAKYSFGNGNHALTSDDGTYGDESGAAVRVPEYEEGEPESPVCYTWLASPTMTATFTISPSLGDASITEVVSVVGTLEGSSSFLFSSSKSVTFTGDSVTATFDDPNAVFVEAVFNGTLELEWGVCETVVNPTHPIYITAGTPTGSVVTVTRISRVTKDGDGLVDEPDIVNTLWDEEAANAPFNPRAEHPSPLWKILDGEAGQCIDIVRFFDLAVKMVGLARASSTIVFCYVDPQPTVPPSHESISSGNFATRGCAIGQNGHTALHGATHGTLRNTERLLYIDGKGRVNNWEACYRYLNPDSGEYEWYAGGTDDSPFGSVQEVMDDVAASTVWRYVTATGYATCADPGPDPENGNYPDGP